MHDSLLRIDREESVFFFLIFVIILWIFSCTRSSRAKFAKNNNPIIIDFTETLNVRKLSENFNTSFKTKKHLSE